MNNISVRRTGPFTAEDRSWLAGPHGTEPGATPTVTLDVASFSTAQKADGYIHSGLALGKITATGLYGPYDNAATDGRETAAGLLFSSVDVSQGQTKVPTGLLVHGFVYEAKLPAAVDTAGKTELRLIHFA